MSKWLLRGLVFAALMVIVRLLQGAMINAWETKAGLISIVLVVLFAIVVFVWGLIDGRADARANPDPDRRGDLAMTWLLAGLFAGVVSGAGGLVHLAVLQEPLRRGADQRDHHVRGVHRAAGLPDGDRRRRARPLARRPQGRPDAAPAPRRRRRRPGRHRRVRRRPPAGRGRHLRRRTQRSRPQRPRVARLSSPSRGWPGTAAPARSPARRGRRSRRSPRR